jgi:hypothetical protein
MSFKTSETDKLKGTADRLMSWESHGTMLIRHVIFSESIHIEALPDDGRLIEIRRSNQVIFSAKLSAAEVKGLAQMLIE